MDYSLRDFWSLELIELVASDFLQVTATVELYVRGGRLLSFSLKTAVALN